MKTIEYLKLARSMTETGSDYALAKSLGMTQQSISNYMNNKRIIDDTTALKLAEVLGIDAAAIIAQANYERAEEKDRKLWADYIKKLGGIAASIFLAVNLLLTPTPSQAAQQHEVEEESLYIMLSRYLIQKAKMLALNVLRNCQKWILPLRFAD